MLSRPQNQIKTRVYDLEIMKDGQIVSREYNVSTRDRRSIIDEYRKEGFQVNSIEVFTAAKNANIIGEHPINSDREDQNVSRYIPGPVEATEKRITTQREKEHARVEEVRLRKISKANAQAKSKSIHSIGRNKNSEMHDLWVAAIRKNGYKVHNTRTDKYFYGFQDEVVRYLHVRINGPEKYRYEEFEIKFLGA